MAEKIHAIFDTPGEAIAAVAELEREGVPRSQITLVSSEPIHPEPAHVEASDSGEGPKTRIGLFAIAGGVAGAATAVLLTVWTSRSVGLVTGGMPVVSPWPFGIIAFELTALGAILATLGRMIHEARLLRRAPLPDYGEAIADGRVVLIVDYSGKARAETVESILASKRAD
jgi:hypothetical protein